MTDHVGDTINANNTTPGHAAERFTVEDGWSRFMADEGWVNGWAVVDTAQQQALRWWPQRGEAERQARELGGQADLEAER